MRENIICLIFNSHWLSATALSNVTLPSCLTTLKLSWNLIRLVKCLKGLFYFQNFPPSYFHQLFVCSASSLIASTFSLHSQTTPTQICNLCSNCLSTETAAASIFTLILCLIVCWGAQWRPYSLLLKPQRKRRFQQQTAVNRTLLRLAGTGGKLRSCQEV